MDLQCDARRKWCFGLALALFSISWGTVFGAPPVVNLWPGKPPGDTATLPPESDQTRPSDTLIAGRRIIKLGNVSTPTLTIYKPAKHKDTGASVVICPGGGHHILAYDLEGTEVAEWLNTLGVTGVLLKYRVPFRDPAKPWLAALQDAQRAVSLVRAHATDWKLDPTRIGLLGFSAGGQITALSALSGNHREYERVDATDDVSSRPDFAILIYPGGLEEKGKAQLRDIVSVTPGAPPMFFVHAFDDPVPVYNSLLLATELKKVGVSAEVHVFAEGGHGYGLRHVDGKPVTDWPKVCEHWMAGQRLLQRPGARTH